MGAVLTVAGWACLSTIRPSPIFAQSDGVKYAVYGDANLDAVVSGVDFTILTGDLGKPLSTLQQGDFNDEGADTGDEFNLLVEDLGKSQNFSTNGLTAADLAAIAAFPDGPTTNFPEPASLGTGAV